MKRIPRSTPGFFRHIEPGAVTVALRITADLRRERDTRRYQQARMRRLVLPTWMRA